MIEWFKRYFGGFAILVLPLAVFMSWLSPWEHPKLFCNGDNPCVREWISALSGWAAAIAAYFTIRTMNRQRGEANQYQRENVELEIMGRLALVRKVLVLVLSNKAECAKQIVLIKHNQGDFYEEFVNFPAHADKIETALRNAIINEYAEEIGWDFALMAEPPLGKAAHLKEEVARYRHSAHLFPVMSRERLIEDGQTIAKSIIDWNTKCIGYFDLLYEDAMAFHRKWHAKTTASVETPPEAAVTRQIGD